MTMKNFGNMSGTRMPNKFMFKIQYNMTPKHNQPFPPKTMHSIDQ